jgi:hypothetical protein
MAVVDADIEILVDNVDGQYRLFDIEHEQAHAARVLNSEATQLALDLDLFPEFAWPTDEPEPDFTPMWEETARLYRPRRNTWGLDVETLPLFETWIKNIQQLHPTEENHG